MSTQHHDALRLAETTPSLRGGDWGDKAAAELRRLHALNAELLEALRVAEASVGDMGSLHIAQAAIAKAEGREA